MRAVGLQFVALLCLWAGLSHAQQVGTANSGGANLERVVLQLSWTHGMRFAGYYLAQEQGFYREAGFDVEIRERRPNVSPIELVVSGDADYGVSSSLLVFHVYGLPVMVLAAMAQHSPFVVLAPERSGIHDLRDFRGKKIMMGSSLMIYEVQVMLASIGISPGEVEIVPHTADIDLFLSGYADACLTFIGSFSHELERRGIPYVAFDPRDYGADSYGEMLFTSRRQALKNPSRVKAFRDASQKGWAWFASHTDEAIQLVAQYVPDAGPEKLASDARVMRELLIDDMVPLGYINTERWVANGKRLAQISQLPYAEEQSRAMLFADYLDGRSLRRNRNLRYGFCVVFGLMVFLGVVALLLRRAVRRRTSELALANHNLNQENAALDQAEKHLCLQRDFAAALVNVKTLSECYRRAVAFMMKIPEVNCCGILVVDASNELLTVKVIQGVDGYLADQSSAGWMETSFGRQLLEGTPFRLNAEAINANLPKLAREGVRTVMVYPVHFFDEVIAAACLGSYQTHAFPDSAPSMIDPMIYMLRNAMLHGKSLEALSDSEMNFKHLVTHGISAIAIVNAEGVVVFANKLFEKLSGYHADEFQSKTVFFKSFFNESQQNLVVTQILAKLDKSNASTLCNLEFIDKSEKTIAVECAARPTIWYSRACTFILIRDISERKRMERDLLQIDEWERVRIAQDLHDSVGQQIAGMAYLVEVLATNLNQSQSVYADSASQLTGIARAAHAQLRDITKGLLPLAGSGTLADALKSLCEQMRLQTSANCAVVDEGLGQIDLDAVTANHLRYIAQEAIANAVRHGNAKNVRIVLTQEKGQGILRIDDDGNGFDQERQRSSGSGLRIMGYRAGIIGGKLSIKRGTPRGMSVCCMFNPANVNGRVNQPVNR